MSTEFGGPLIGKAEPLIAVIDTGGTWTRAALGAERIEAENIWRTSTAHQLEEHTENVARLVELVTDNRRPDILAYGIAGNPSANGLTIVEAGALKKYGWLNQPIVEQASAATGVPLDQIILMNDLVAPALAEREQDRRKITGSKNILTLLPDEYVGVVKAISTGTNNAVYDKYGAENMESGHNVKIDKEAAGPCGCGQCNDAEAWISGTGILNRFGISGKDMDPEDPRWHEYRADLGIVMDAEFVMMNGLLAARNRNQHIRTLKLFGSVATGNSGAIPYLRERYPGLTITETTYGEDGGLYGGYFAGLEKLAA